MTPGVGRASAFEAGIVRRGSADLENHHAESVSSAAATLCSRANGVGLVRQYFQLCALSKRTMVPSNTGPYSALRDHGVLSCDFLLATGNTH